MDEKEYSEEPKFLAVSRELAQEQGRDMEELLLSFFQRVLDSDYPRPDCLEPEEVEDFISLDSISPERLLHVRDCPECTALLDAARPISEAKRQFLRQVKQYGEHRKLA